MTRFGRLLLSLCHLKSVNFFVRYSQDARCKVSNWCRCGISALHTWMSWRTWSYESSGWEWSSALSSHTGILFWWISKCLSVHIDQIQKAGLTTHRCSFVGRLRKAKSCRRDVSQYFLVGNGQDWICLHLRPKCLSFDAAWRSWWSTLDQAAAHSHLWEIQMIEAKTIKSVNSIYDSQLCVIKTSWRRSGLPSIIVVCVSRPTTAGRVREKHVSDW